MRWASQEQIVSQHIDLSDDSRDRPPDDGHRPLAALFPRDLLCEVEDSLGNLFGVIMITNNGYKPALQR